MATIQKDKITRAETSTHVGLATEILEVDEIFHELGSGRVSIGEIPEILARADKILGVEKMFHTVHDKNKRPLRQDPPKPPRPHGNDADISKKNPVF